MVFELASEQNESTQVPRLLEEILILTNGGEGQPAGLSWQPFQDGKAIERIVLDSYERYRECMAEGKLGYLADCAADMLPVPELITRSLSELDPSAPVQLDRISIVLLNLDAVGGWKKQLAIIRDSLLALGRHIHLVQISRLGDVETAVRLFGPTGQVLIADPEICREESQLARFLNRFFEIQMHAWRGAAQNPFDTPCKEGAYRDPYVHPRHGHFVDPQGARGQSIARVYRDYRRKLPALIADVRDTAMARELVEAQVVNLGLAAAMQEFLLRLAVEQLQLPPGTTVSVASIRRPLSDIPVDSPLGLRDLQPARLVELHLTYSEKQPTLEECDALETLGLGGSAVAALHFNRSELLEITARLSGRVAVRPFMAELPAWDFEPEPSQARFTESSFGVNVEESFSRSFDSYYIEREAATQ
ncbi:MAG: hypothetical protein ACWGPS_04945 [Candidatus Promineifilaceae bacterium]